jgi:hypothetical protein
MGRLSGKVTLVTGSGRNIGRTIIWDANGADNYFDEEVSSSFPPVLPKKSWPQPVYNLYWRLMNFVVGLVG